MNFEFLTTAGIDEAGRGCLAGPYRPRIAFRERSAGCASGHADAGPYGVIWSFGALGGPDAQKWGR